MSEVLQVPTKSLKDEKEYRLLRLENGLKALCVHHPQTGKSNKLAAANLLVNVGGLDDPRQAQGLSHFLEHMLFLGSEKFPIEDDYSKFIEANGGYVNAATSFGDTVYIFDIIEDEFESALGQLAAMATAPILSRSSVEREVNSVESEFQNSLNKDDYRLQQFVYSYIVDSHPANSFVIGNLKTLKEDNGSDELHRLLKEHFQKFYVANRMVVVIQSSKSLDDLQEIAEKNFSVVARGEPREKFSDDFFKEILKPGYFDKITYIKPVNNTKLLMLAFPLPAVNTFSKSSSLKYLQKLIESSEKGGLVDYLKKRFEFKTLQMTFTDFLNIRHQVIDCRARDG